MEAGTANVTAVFGHRRRAVKDRDYRRRRMVHKTAAVTVQWS